MGDRPDASYVMLQHEVTEAMTSGRYHLVLSLLDVLDARATTAEQRAWLQGVRGSVEAALRMEGQRDPP